MANRMAWFSNKMRRIACQIAANLLRQRNDTDSLGQQIPTYSLWHQSVTDSRRRQIIHFRPIQVISSYICISSRLTLIFRFPSTHTFVFFFNDLSMTIVSSSTPICHTLFTMLQFVSISTCHEHATFPILNDQKWIAGKLFRVGIVWTQHCPIWTLQNSNTPRYTSVAATSSLSVRHVPHCKQDQRRLF